MGYTVLLTVLVAVELLVAVFATLQRYSLEVTVVDWLRTDFFRNVTEDKQAEHAKQWDAIQYTVNELFEFNCCGVNGPHDYVALGAPVGVACCRTAHTLKANQGRQQHYELCLKEKTYERFGCEDEILFALRESSESLLCISCVGLIFEGSGMVMAMWLTNYLKDKAKLYKQTLKY